MIQIFANVCVCLLLLKTLSYSAEPPTLDPALEPLRPFIGKTWRGEFKNNSSGKPTIDVARWERALNGKAIRILHSVNDGAYGGESIVRWDADKKQITYFYFSTAGFYTTGSMTCADGKLSATEIVKGSSGSTEVRSTYELQQDGTLLNKAEYFKGDAKTGSREVLYKIDPDAEVKFR